MFGMCESPSGITSKGYNFNLGAAHLQAFLVHMEQQRRMKLGPDAPPMEQGGVHATPALKKFCSCSRGWLTQGELDLMKALFRPQTVEDMMEKLGLL